MADTLGTFEVGIQLGLDKLTKNQAQANSILKEVQGSLGKVEASAKKTEKSLGGLGFMAMKLDGILNIASRGISGIKHAMELAANPGSILEKTFNLLGGEASEFSEQMKRQAVLLGTTTGRAQALDAAFKVYVGGAGNASMMTLRLGNAMEQARGKGGAMAAAFKDLKGNVFDLVKSGASSIDVFKATIMQLGKMEDKIKANAIAWKFFGRMGAASILDLADDLHGADFEKYFQDLGLIVQDKTIRAIESLGDHFALLKRFGLVARTELVGALVPAFERLADGAQALASKITNWVKKNQGDIERFADQVVTQLEAMGRAFIAWFEQLDSSKITTFVAGLDSLIIVMQGVALMAVTAAAGMSYFVKAALLLKSIPDFVKEMNTDDVGGNPPKPTNPLEYFKGIDDGLQAVRDSIGQTIELYQRLKDANGGIGTPPKAKTTADDKPPPPSKPRPAFSTEQIEAANKALKEQLESLKATYIETEAGSVASTKFSLAQEKYAAGSAKIKKEILDQMQANQDLAEQMQRVATAEDAVADSEKHRIDAAKKAQQFASDIALEEIRATGTAEQIKRAEFEETKRKKLEGLQEEVKAESVAIADLVIQRTAMAAAITDENRNVTQSTLDQISAEVTARQAALSTMLTNIDRYDAALSASFQRGSSEFGQTVETFVSDSFSGVILQTAKVKDAWKSMCASLLKEWTNTVSKLVIRNFFGIGTPMKTGGMLGGIFGGGPTTQPGATGAGGMVGGMATDAVRKSVMQSLFGATPQPTAPGAGGQGFFAGLAGKFLGGAAGGKAESGGFFEKGIPKLLVAMKDRLGDLLHGTVKGLGKIVPDMKMPELLKSLGTSLLNGLGHLGSMLLEGFKFIGWLLDKLVALAASSFSIFGIGRGKTGGLISGSGQVIRARWGALIPGESSDAVPVIAHAGEGILTAHATRRIGGLKGLAKLERGAALAIGGMARFDRGGVVGRGGGDEALGAGSGAYFAANSVNVHVPSGDSHEVGRNFAGTVRRAWGR